MSPDLRITPTQWLTAAAAALALHVILVLAIGEADLRGDMPSAAGPKETRLRLSLGRPAPPAAAGPEATAGSPSPSPPTASERPKAAATRPAAPKRASAAPPTPTSASPQEPLAVSSPDPTSTAQSEAPVSAALGTQSAELRRLHPSTPAANSESRPGVAVTPSAGSSIDGAARADYFDRLFAQVVASLDYPRRARLDEVEGTVVLSVRIDRTGEIERCEVAETAGSPLLDRHAMRIVRRAAPFGPVPDSLDDIDLDFDLPLEFSLSD